MTEARHAIAANARLIAAPSGRRVRRSRVVRVGESDHLTDSDPGQSAQSAQSATELWLTARLDAARHGDEVAFADLYRDTQPRLYRYAVTLVGREAEDVTAEAWLQIARDLRRFVGDAHDFRAWAATVVRHRAIDHLRSAARRPVVLVDTDLERPSGSDTEDRAAESVSTAAALELIATLPRDQAEAVLLRAVMGLDAATAGKVLGKRPGAVRVAAHRGLRSLGRLLDQDGAELVAEVTSHRQ